MKKIVELLISREDLQLEELGVDILSMVENPAIGYEWFAFSADQEEYCEDCFDLDEACWPGYEAIGMKNKNGKLVPNCVPVDAAMKFESITDYPEYIKEAAAKGIRLNEAEGNKCGTQVGKVRAQQLANGEPISEETVRRMYSYLSRAGVYYDASDETSCGTISYLLWGGPEALEWSEKQVAKFDEERVQNAIIEAAEQMGEDIDERTTVYLSEQDFAEENTTVSKVTDAVKALDILSKRNSEERAQIVYKYEGPISSNSRKFCRAMVGLSRTKVFRRDEIQRMSDTGINSAFARKGRSSYDIFKYAGGALCRHRWVEYKMFKGSAGKTILIMTGNEGTPPNDMPNGAFVTRTKRGLFSAEQQNFATIDEDQQIVVAPAMVPEVLIKRRNEMGQEYFVYFSKDTIKEIAEKFFRKNYQNNTDINHDGNVTQVNTLLESWIVEDPEKDKAAIYGFDVPAGTWMVSMRVNDPETWKQIKSGELKGYSISGNFLERAVK